VLDNTKEYIWKMNLDCSPRQVVLIFITICFVALVTGASLQLHLLSEVHPEKHDSEHCSLCQQLLLAPGKFILEPELAVETGSQIECYIKSHSTIYIKQFHYQQFDPRPPPASI